MVRPFSTLALLALSLLPACAFSSASAPLSVDERGGRLFVDGEPLDHHREVALDGELAAGDLVVLATHTGMIDVVGVPGDRYELVVDLYSEHEGDGRVSLDDGVLRASGGRGRAVVNGIRGRLPEGVHLQIRSATGDVILTSFSGQVETSVESGTGSVQVQGCSMQKLSVDAATGSVRLSDSRVANMTLDTGTGSFMAEDSDLSHFAGESGTGDFRFRDCRLQWARFISATGNVVLRGSPVSEMMATLGTGELLEQPSDVTQAPQQSTPEAAPMRAPRAPAAPTTPTPEAAPEVTPEASGSTGAGH